jgi:tetratricopeptide (TPR) repeat protein
MRMTPHSPLDPVHVSQWREAIRRSTEAHYHYHMGLALRRSGEGEHARRQFCQALDRDPAHARARCALIELAKATGQVDQARALHEAGLAIDPTFILRAEVERCEEVADTDPDAAQGLFQSLENSGAVRAVPGLVLADNLLRLVAILTAAGRLAPAAAILRTSCAAEPSNAESYAKLAELSLRLQDVEGLEACLTAAETNGLETPALLFARGQYLILRRDYAGADAALTRAIGQGHPDPTQLVIFRGRIRLARGDHAEAEQLLDTVGGSWLAQAYTLLARLHIAPGPDLIREAETIEIKAGGQEFSRVVKAFVLERLGRGEEALALLERLLASNPSYIVPAAAAILWAGRPNGEGRARDLLDQALGRRGPFFDFVIDGLPGGRVAVDRLSA